MMLTILFHYSNWRFISFLPIVIFKHYKFVFQVYYVSLYIYGTLGCGFTFKESVWANFGWNYDKCCLMSKTVDLNNL